MEAKPQFHGSDTAAVAAFYHVPVDEIVCFGANVNPLGLSKNLKKDLADIWIFSVVIRTEITLL